MAEDQKNLRLDAMLDSLLSTYSSAEPRPGLEIRIRATLEARAAQRRRAWILMMAGAAAVLALATMVTTQLRPSRPSTPVNIATVTSPPPAAAVLTHPTIQPFRSSKVNRLAAGRRASPTNQALLLAANATTEPANLVFEQEKLYVAPVLPSPPETRVEKPASAPTITIQDLGVQFLEIKELPSAKNTDSKGDLW